MGAYILKCAIACILFDYEGVLHKLEDWTKPIPTCESWVLESFELTTNHDKHQHPENRRIQKAKGKLQDENESWDGRDSFVQ